MKGVRKMIKKYVMITIVILCVVAVGTFIYLSSHTDHNNSEIEHLKGHGDKHSHYTPMPTEDHGDHDIHRHDDQGDSELMHVRITRAQSDQFCIKIAEAAQGFLNRTIRVPGELKLNEDRVAHISTQFSGIVRRNMAQIGGLVAAGQVLAVLDSRELAEARAAYLAAVERKKLANDIFKREERLWEKQITSEIEYLSARLTLAERDIDESSARHQLLALGVQNNVTEPASSSLSHYELRSPISGWVLENNFAFGESFQGGAVLFKIADLSTVWIDLSVSSENLGELRKGLPIEIEISTEKKIDAEITYVAPVIEKESRTAIVRAIIKNEEDSLRPGLFVNADIRLPSWNITLLLPKESVQIVHDHPCVFVWKDGQFELREVVPGVSDRRHTEILQGLKAGELVAVENAFHLKAEYIKTAAGDNGSHHGHSH